MSFCCILVAFLHNCDNVFYFKVLKYNNGFIVDLIK